METAAEITAPTIQTPAPANGLDRSHGNRGKRRSPRARRNMSEAQKRVWAKRREARAQAEAEAAMDDWFSANLPREIKFDLLVTIDAVLAEITTEELLAELGRRAKS
jgi:hypothetical protein